MKSITHISAPTATATATYNDQKLPARRVRRSRLTWLILAPALLGFALLGAACGNSSSPTSDSNSLIVKGLAAEKHGQAQEALSDFKKAASENPASAVPYYDLGVVYQQSLNDPQQAANEYNKAILINPRFKPALFNLAILDTSSNPPEAMYLYSELLKLNPNDANVLFNLGLLQLTQNESLQGHANLTKAIALDHSLAARVPKGITP